MFSRLEEDTKKQIERSKNGTRFFADYYKDYINGLVLQFFQS